MTPPPGETAAGSDPYDLERFVAAQDAFGTFASVLAELRAGVKHGHWIWFVFPQVAGLGRSQTSRRYAIGSLDEAQAFLAHPILGPRLHTCAELLLAHRGRRAEPAERVFEDVLDAFFGGEPDAATERILVTG